METQMSYADDWERLIREARPLTPERWDVIKRAALRRASEARTQEVCAMLRTLGALAARAAPRLTPQPVERGRKPRAAR
jgi:hypothetical protein